MKKIIVILTIFLYRKRSRNSNFVFHWMCSAKNGVKVPPNYGGLFNFKKNLLLGLIMLLLQINSNAQETRRKTFWAGLELGQGMGLIETGKKTGNISGYMPVTNARLKLGYYLTPRFSLGAGICAGAYQYYEINAIPFFVDIRYHFSKRNRWFSFADIGYAIGSDDLFFSKGFVSDIGVGYQIRLWKRLMFNPSVSYNLVTYKFDIFRDMYQTLQPIETRVRHSLCVNLALDF